MGGGGGGGGGKKKALKKQKKKSGVYSISRKIKLKKKNCGIVNRINITTLNLLDP